MKIGENGIKGVSMTIFGLKIMTVKKYDEDILHAFNEGVKKRLG